MAWVLLVIALGVAVGLIIISYGLNRAVIALLVCLLVAVVGAIYYTETQDGQRQDVIADGLIRLDNFTMAHAYGDSFKLSARVNNGSTEHTLTVLGVTITAADCATASHSECVIVGEQSREIHISIPPAQARDISEQFQFRNMRPKGDLRWEYKIAYNKGY